MTRPTCWLRWLMVASSYGTTPMLSTQIKICWPKLCTRKIPGELIHCVCFWRLVTLLGVSIFVGWTPIFEFNNKKKISYCHSNEYINPRHVDPIFWTKLDPHTIHFVVLAPCIFNTCEISCSGLPYGEKVIVFAKHSNYLPCYHAPLPTKFVSLLNFKYPWK